MYTARIKFLSPTIECVMRVSCYLQGPINFNLYKLNEISDSRFDENRGP